MKLPVIKIVKESYQHAWKHRLEWFKVGFAPLLIWGFLFFAMYMSGLKSSYINGLFQFVMDMLDPGLSYRHIITYNVVLMNSATPNYNILFWLFTFLMWLPHISLSINGYRYAMLQEGMDKWFTLNLNKRFVRLLIYNLLLFFVCLAVSGIVTFTIVLIRSFISPVGFIEAIIIASMLSLLVAYFHGRLAFTFLLISLDKIKPISSSWQLSKGNVLRILAILLSILIPACFFNLALNYGIAWVLIKANHFDVTVALILKLRWLIAILIAFILWAAGKKAFALTYQALTKNEGI